MYTTFPWPVILLLSSTSSYSRLFLLFTGACDLSAVQCDFEDKKEGSLKKIVDEAVKAKASFTDKEVRGAVRKMFAEKYSGQATSKVSDKKATGLAYFYNKLRF